MTKIDLNDVTGTRPELRKRIHDVFSAEQPGTGKGEKASRYLYFVERLADGRRIFLKRPTWLNKGVDFMVCVEHTHFRQGRYSDMARFSDIINDLALKKDDAPRVYSRAKSLIRKVYHCHELNDTEYRGLNFPNGHSIELMLKLLKWLFIEQDVTYWNYSGRAKLYDGLKDSGLV